MLFYRIYFAISLSVAVDCHAASFDCEKAKGWVEETICEAQELSQLDDVLLRTYQAALAVVPNRNVLQTGQRHWLTESRNRCKDAECIVQAYQMRISELEHTWNERFKSVRIDFSKASSGRANPFEGEWKSCQLWKGEEICSSYVLVQKGERVCGEWEYWATYRTYGGQLQASSRTPNRANLELICGSTGSESQTECDNNTESRGSWENAKGGLAICAGRLFSVDVAKPCTKLPLTSALLYRPLAARVRNQLVAQPWARACLGIGQTVVH